MYFSLSFITSLFAEKLSYLITSDKEVLAENPDERLGEKGKGAILHIYSQIIAGMQVALAGFILVLKRNKSRKLLNSIMSKSRK